MPIILSDQQYPASLRSRDPLFEFADSGAWPRGIEAVLEYDGYVFNDRRRADRIVIEKIGLGRPDLQAQAEKNADRDGETPMDMTYGGRTITLRGYVRAGNLDRMRALYSYLEDAFDDVSEKPLWMRWLDWKDEFVDPYALIDYSFDSGVDTVEVADDGTGLAPTDTTTKQFRVFPQTAYGTCPERLTYADGEGVLRFRAGASATGIEAGIVMRRIGATTVLIARYTRSTGKIHLVKIVSGVVTALASTSGTLNIAVGEDYYIKARIKGADTSFSLWGTMPPDIGGTPLLEVTHTLSAPDLAAFPDEISGSTWGVWWVPNSASDRISLLDVAAIDKGDAIIYCRKAAPIDPGDEEQVDWKYQRPFMVTLRASDSRMVSRKPTTVSIVPSSFGLVFPIDGSGLMFPIDGSGLIFGAPLPTPVMNLGRSPASMVIRLYGEMVDPVVYHPLTGKSIGVIGTIADGDYFEFDTGRHTVVDSLGAERYSMLTDETSWPELLRGSNQLYLGANSVSGAGKIVITYRHSSR